MKPMRVNRTCISGTVELFRTDIVVRCSNDTTSNSTDQRPVDDSGTVVDPLTDSNFIVFMSFYVYTFSVVGTLGIVANCINLSVFIKMGLSDGMNTMFFHLSAVDLGVAVFSALSGLAIVPAQIRNEVRFFFSAKPLAYAIYVFPINFMSTFVGGSVLLTTFLAIQRCCCVALPFHFRRIFTKKSITFGIIVIHLTTAVCSAGYASMYYMMWMTGPGSSSNSSMVHLVYRLVAREHRNILMYYIMTVQMFVMTFGCEIVVLLCLVVMVIGLRRSAQFRQEVARSGTTTTTTTTTESKNSDQGEPKSTTTSSAGKSDAKVSHQPSENRVMKTVLLISVVFVTCNSPSILFTLLKMFISEFDTYGRLSNSYIMGIFMTSFFQLLSSTLNICIYFKTNTKFNSILKSSFKRSS